MTDKKKILMFLPMMKELELVGVNPIENMTGKQTIEKIESRYIAFASAKKKYPEWDRVISGFFGRIMKDWEQ